MDANEQVWVLDAKALNKFEGLELSKFVTSPSAVHSFWQSLEHAFFMSRGEAEVLPAYKQIIPYMVLSSQGKYLTYRRAGSEARLSDKFSIGAGGHINPADVQEFRKRMVYHAALRELDEELELNVGGGRFPLSTAVQDGDLGIHGLLYDPSDEVGRVHLGLVLQLTLPWETAMEVRMSTEGKDVTWKSLSELHEVPNLEGWSHILLPYLNDAITTISLKELAGA